MRTTVEITSEQRARLLELAASRGERGFSRIVQEALDAYLAAQTNAERGRRARALALRGTLDERAAQEFYATSAALRRSWR